MKERKWTNARHVSCTEHSQKEEPHEEEVEIFHLSSPLFLSLSGQLGATHLFQTCRVISLNDENDAAVICPSLHSLSQRLLVTAAGWLQGDEGFDPEFTN